MIIAENNDKAEWRAFLPHPTSYFLVTFLSIHYSLCLSIIRQSRSQKATWKWLHFFTEMMGPTMPRHARKSGLPPALFLPLVTRPNLQLHYKSNNIATVKENTHDVRLHIRGFIDNLDIFRLTTLYHVNFLTLLFYGKVLLTRCYYLKQNYPLLIACDFFGHKP